jgi:GNAT superfamily N-acetyltransferase
VHHVAEQSRLAERLDRAGALVATDFLLELLVFGAEPAVLGGTAADRHHVVVGERLLDIVERALVDGLNGCLQRGLGGHEDDGCFGVLPAHRGQNLDTGHPGHLEVGQDDVRRRGLELLETGFTALGGGDVEAFVLQQDPQCLENALLIIDDQYRGRGGGRRIHQAASSFRRAAGK